MFFNENNRKKRRMPRRRQSPDPFNMALGLVGVAITVPIAVAALQAINSS